MNSIKKKLIIPVASVVILSVLFSNILSNLILSDSYEKQIQLKHANLANSIVSNVQSFIEKAYIISEQLAATPSMSDFNSELQTEMAAATYNRYSFIDLIFIQDSKGMQTARSKGNLGDRSERWWYKKIILDEKAFVSKSYYSLAGNIAVTSVFIPIRNKSKTLTGIFGMDLKLGSLQDVVEKFSNETTYAFVIDGQGTVVAHPEKDRVSQLYNYINLEKTVLVKDTLGNVKYDAKGFQLTEKQNFKVSSVLSEITREALNGQSGYREYDNLEGERVFSHYSSIQLPGYSDGWAMITFEKVEDAQFLKNRSTLVNNIFSIASAFIIVLVLMLIAKQLVARINHVTASLNELAKGGGDLTRRLSVDSDDEVAQLSNDFNTFMEKLQTIISDVKTNSTAVAKDSIDLASNNKEIANSMNKQSIQFSNLATITETMSTSSEMISESLNEAVSIIELTNQNIDSGTNQLNLAISEIGNISTNVNELGNTITTLTKSSAEIDGMLNVINDIASQTNLLALNAAIEAARAGEYGRGFAVVADEIRQLALRTQTSTQEIENIVFNLQTESIKATSAMSQTAEQVERGVTNVNDTKIRFEQIVETVGKLSTINYSVKSAIDEQTSSITNINVNTQDILVVLDNITETSQDISTTTIELGAQAEKLKSIVDQFKVD